MLWARGDELERQLDFGIVDQLLREAAAAGLASPPALPRDGTRPDPLAVGEIVLGLVEDYGATGRCSSSSTTRNGPTWRRCRRCRSPPAACTIGGPCSWSSSDRGARASNRSTDSCATGAAAGCASLRSPCSALAELVRTRAGIGLTARAAERLHAHTGGNPLETVTLVDELDPVTLIAGLGPLPAPRSYASMVLGRMSACSPEAEQLVAAVAVAGALELDGLARMTASAELADAAVGGRASTGSWTSRCEAGGRVVDVAHPLIRAAVLDDLPPGRLAELHAAAAATVDDPDRAFRHELRAHLGRHPELAAEGIRRAHARLADGWELSAVELLVLGGRSARARERRAARRCCRPATGC